MEETPGWDQADGVAPAIPNESDAPVPVPGQLASEFCEDVQVLGSLLKQLHDSRKSERDAQLQLMAMVHRRPALEPLLSQYVELSADANYTQPAEFIAGGPNKRKKRSGRAQANRKQKLRELRREKQQRGMASSPNNDPIGAGVIGPVSEPKLEGLSPAVANAAPPEFHDGGMVPAPMTTTPAPIV